MCEIYRSSGCLILLTSSILGNITSKTSPQYFGPLLRLAGLIPEMMTKKTGKIKRTRGEVESPDQQDLSHPIGGGGRLGMNKRRGPCYRCDT
jgi:hypothetical protein